MLSLQRTALVLLIALISFSSSSVAGEWPSAQDGLRFALQDGMTPATFFGSEGTARLGWRLVPKGYGHLRHDGVLMLGHGGFAAEQRANELAGPLVSGENFSLALGIHVGETMSDGALLTVAAGGKNQFAVTQVGDALHVEFNGASGKKSIAAGEILPSTTTDLLVTANGESLTVYRDSAQIESVQWTRQQETSQEFSFYLGELSPKVAGWSGGLDGIGLYTRALTKEEIDVVHQEMKDVREGRPAVESVRVRAKLVGKSTVLTPAELAPYRQGLTVFLYDVEAVLSGDYDGSQLHVAHWTALDDTALPFGGLPMDSVLELQLEAYDDNPQLATENLSDDIVEDFSIPYFYDAGGRALRGLPVTPPK